ncbi:MAG: alpha/beta fold hydrolase [Pseudomonadota bacterium]
MQRGYVNIGTQSEPIQLHFRMQGSGPAVVFLHPSPMSSVSMMPMVKRASDKVTAIALDTPGYGYSDDLPDAVNDLSPYVHALDKFRQGLGLETLGLYGSATGAQIAIEYAKAYESQCDFIILDNAADFTDEDRDRITEGYFPDLNVETTGGHLMRTWGLALDQLRFFPWHDHSEACRLPAFPIDPDMVQTMVGQFLQAGGDYDKAYRVAFKNEQAKRLLDVNVSTTVLRWDGSILKKYTDQFDNHDWPSNFHMQHVPADKRLEGIDEALTRHMEGMASVSVSVPDDKSCAGPRFANLSYGSVHEVCSGGEGTPWLLLHDLGSSSCAIKPVIQAFAQSHGLLAPDLPGHGASDLRLDSDLDFITGSSGVIQGLLNDYGMKKVNVLAMGEAAALGIEIGRQTSSLIGKIVLLNPVQHLKFLSAEPVLDGSHLTTLWHQLKNQSLFLDIEDMTPKSALAGDPELDPKRLNQRVLDLMRSRPAYAHAKASTDAYDIVSCAKEVSCPLVIARTESTTAGEGSRRSFPTLTDAQLMDLPSDPSDWPELLQA